MDSTAAAATTTSGKQQQVEDVLLQAQQVEDALLAPRDLPPRPVSLLAAFHVSEDLVLDQGPFFVNYPFFFLKLTSCKMAWEFPTQTKKYI